MARLKGLLLWLVSMSAMAQPMLVGSYNIRYKNTGDSLRGDVWAKRCQVICDQVNFMSPDIFGAQEVLYPQLIDLLHGLDGYDYIGVGRDDGKTEGEYAAIFYKKDRIRLLEQGHFWLSETPEKPGLGWDAACVRICTWGKFSRVGHDGCVSKTCETPPAFYFFNLHMDHVGKVARREAAKLVVEQILTITGREEKSPLVVLTGDFNVDQNDEIYRIFTESGVLKDSYECARLRFAENGTFNSWKQDLLTESRIDHVFVSPTANVDAYGVLTDGYWTRNEQSDEQQKASDAPQQISFSPWTRRNPSDHYPVFVRVTK